MSFCAWEPSLVDGAATIPGMVSTQTLADDIGRHLHLVDQAREEAVRKQVRKAMAERENCGCEAIDFRKRRKLDKALHRENLQRLSCASRQSVRLKEKGN